jgi:predicted  nucleic acid-binding Zn-ribbon protein
MPRTLGQAEDRIAELEERVAELEGEVQRQARRIESDAKEINSLTAQVDTLVGSTADAEETRPAAAADRDRLLAELRSRIASAYLAGAPELVDTLEQVVGEVQEALGWV